MRRVQHAAEEVEQRLCQVVRIRRDRFLALLSDERDPGLQVPELRNRKESNERLGWKEVHTLYIARETSTSGEK